MIEGHGDIASVLVDRPDRLYFASGVSNSQETRESEYNREAKLLLTQDSDKRLVYFGSLSIFYSDSRYARHKREMEERVKKIFPRYTIVRLGNIDWGTNPNTIINNLKARYQRGEELQLQDAYRYVVSKDEFLHWMNLIPDWNCEMNITGTRLKVQEIVDKYVRS